MSKIEFNATTTVFLGEATSDHDAIEAVVLALTRAQDLFVRGGSLVRALANGSLHVLNESGLREAISRQVVFEKPDRGGRCVMRCPDWIPRMILARGEWPGIRVAENVARAPFVTPQGQLVAEAGYHAPTRTYLLSDVVVSPPPAPTRDDARRAVEVLREPILDFPFADDHDQAAALAHVLTLSALLSFDGAAPGFVFCSPVPGTGKGLLASVGHAIAFGGHPAMFAFVDNAEMTRRLTGIALQGITHVVLDNVRGTLGSPALEMAITARTLGDRKVRTAEVVETPYRLVISVTANNPDVTPDMGRRLVPVRLDAGVARPDTRRDFRHADLLGFVAEHRGALLTAALTVILAYMRAGRPSIDLEPFGSFEAWDRTIRHALVWAGVPDPIARRGEFVEEHDFTLVALRALVAWAGERGEWTAADLSKSGERGLIEVIVDGPRTDLSTVCRRLGTFVGRPVDGRVLRRRHLNRGWVYSFAEVVR
jgi:hypothetical protein